MAMGYRYNAQFFLHNMKTALQLLKSKDQRLKDGEKIAKSAQRGKYSVPSADMRLS